MKGIGGMPAATVRKKRAAHAGATATTSNQEGTRQQFWEQSAQAS
eukprot:SAG11_NODE_19329_length_469_cov_0.805405_1_plen_44_part_10